MEENLIENWDEAIGLTITKINHFTIECDDPADHTIITFSNGKIAIQRDQPYFTTSCGLLDKDDVKRYANEIEQAIK